MFSLANRRQMLALAFLVAEAYATISCELKTPTPIRRDCGVPGRFYDIYNYGGSYPYNDVQQNTTVASLTDCVHLAFGHFASIALGYNDGTKVCSIISDGSPGFGRGHCRPHIQCFKPDNSSDTVYFHRDCYACAASCPPAYDTNIIYNGGLEMPLDAFNFTGWNPRDIVTPGHNSAHALQLGSRPNYNDEYITQTPLYCHDPQQPYLWSFDFKYNDIANATKTKQAVNLWLDMKTGLRGELYLTNQPQTGEWHTLKYSGSGNPRHIRGFYTEIAYDYPESVETTNQLYIDNYRVSAIAPGDFPPATTGPNLITNGDFESGDISAWKHSGFILAPGSKLAGPASANENNKFAIQPNLESRRHAASLGQPIRNLKSYVQYLVQFDYRFAYEENCKRRKGEPCFYGRHTVEILGENYNLVNTLAYHDLIHNQTSTFSWIWTPHYSDFTLRFSFEKTGRTMYLDNFSLKEIA